jgi:hypothetical protein
MSASNSYDTPLNVGDKVTLKIGHGFGTHEVEITYVGSQSVKVKDELGRIHTMNKWAVSRQLYGWPKRRKLTKKQRQARQQEFEEWVISTPTGGQPGYRR